jgi:hypothetical protein
MSRRAVSVQPGRLPAHVRDPAAPANKALAINLSGVYSESVDWCSIIKEERS